IKIRIEKDMHEDEDQSGFRAGRSCVDNIFTLRQMIDKRLACGLQTHLAFVDIHKAYDSVPLCRLWKILSEEKIHPKYVKAIQNLYTNITSQVKCGKNLSKKFEVTKGLRQGCCLAPTLFKIYIQKALNKWKRHCRNMGIEVDDDFLYTLHYADDQVICAE